MHVQECRRLVNGTLLLGQSLVIVSETLGV